MFGFPDAGLPNSPSSYTEFRTSGIWQKPAGATTFYVELMNGGYGANSSVAVSGGAFKSATFKYADLPSSVVVTVGAGGVGGAGGVSSFGSNLVPRTFTQAYNAANTQHDGSTGSAVFGGSGSGVTVIDPYSGESLAPSALNAVNTTDRKAGANGADPLSLASHPCVETYAYNGTGFMQFRFVFTSGSFDYVPCIGATSNTLTHLVKFNSADYSTVVDVVPLKVSVPRGLWFANGYVFYQSSGGYGSSTATIAYASLSSILAGTASWSTFVLNRNDIYASSSLGGVEYWGGYYYFIASQGNGSSVSIPIEFYRSADLVTTSYLQTITLNTNAGGTCSAMGSASNVNGVVFVVNYQNAGSQNAIFKTTNGTVWTDLGSLGGAGMGQIGRPRVTSSGIICFAGTISDVNVQMAVCSISYTLSALYYTPLGALRGGNYGSLAFHPPSLCIVAGSNTVYAMTNSYDASYNYYTIVKATVNTASAPTALYGHASWLASIGTTSPSAYGGGAYIQLSLAANPSTINAFLETSESSAANYITKRVSFSESGSALTGGTTSTITNSSPVTSKVWPFSLAGGNGYGGSAGGKLGNAALAAGIPPSGPFLFKFLGFTAEPSTTGGNGFVKVWSW